MDINEKLDFNSVSSDPAPAGSININNEDLKLPVINSGDFMINGTVSPVSDEI